MQDAQRHEEIMFKLGVIQNRVDGVITRLDTLNGKVADHEKKFQEEALRNSFGAGQKKVMSNMKKAVITLLSIAVAILGIFASSGCWRVVCHS